MRTLAGIRTLRRPQHIYYGWVLVVTLGLTTIISYGTTQYFFGVLVEPLGREFGWSRASISGAYSLSVVLAGFLGVPIGRLVDRRGARLLMTVGSAVAGLSLLGLAGVTALWQFYLLWAGGLGLATALTFYPVTFTVVANWFLRRRGSALALLTLLGGLASPIFIPLAGALVLHLGWRGTVIAFGVAQLAVAFPLHGVLLRRHPEDMGLLPDGASRPSQQPATELPGLDLSASLHGVAFWTLSGAISLSSLATSVILVHQVAYLIGRGQSGIVAASVAGLVGLSSLPGRYVLNLLSDRLGSQRLLSLCLVVMAVGTLLLLHGDSFGWLVAYIIVYGAAFGAVSPLRASVMADQFGRRAYGAITAVQGVLVALCAAGGPLVAGWLYDVLGRYDLAFWLSAGAFFLAGLCVVATPKSRLSANSALLLQQEAAGVSNQTSTETL
jgi:MFS family permease